MTGSRISIALMPANGMMTRSMPWMGRLCRGRSPARALVVFHAAQASGMSTMMTMAEGDGGENCRVDQTQVHDVEPIHLRESIRKPGRDDGEPESFKTEYFWRDARTRRYGGLLGILYRRLLTHPSRQSLQARSDTRPRVRSVCIVCRSRPRVFCVAVPQRRGDTQADVLTALPIPQ